MGAQVMYTDAELLQMAEEFQARNQKAEKASKEWEERKAALQDHMARHPGNYRDKSTKREKIKTDWGLNDAMDTYNWNRREARRIADEIYLEQALRAMLVESRYA